MISERSLPSKVNAISDEKYRTMMTETHISEYFDLQRRRVLVVEVRCKRTHDVIIETTRTDLLTMRVGSMSAQRVRQMDTQC